MAYVLQSQHKELVHKNVCRYTVIVKYTISSYFVKMKSPYLMTMVYKVALIIINPLVKN